MSNRLFKIILIISIIIAVYKWYDAIPYVKGNTSNAIITANDPIQLPTNAKDFIFRTKIYTYTIIPLAYYKISGIVVARNSLFSGEEGAIGPVDLGMIWGNIAVDNFDKYITFESSGRWLTPHLETIDAPYPFVWGYVKVHASHTHVIPANKNVLNAINSLNKKQKASLEGYLVKVMRTDGWLWQSSLSREDWGAHSCEVMYVMKVQIDDKLYY